MKFEVSSTLVKDHRTAMSTFALAEDLGDRVVVEATYDEMKKALSDLLGDVDVAKKVTDLIKVNSSEGIPG